MSKQLLVIDDEPKITEALSEWFSSRGFSVSTAATVQAALTHVHRTSTDIVLLDLRLPDGSGMELLSQIKTQFPNLRVVVMSGLSDVKTIQEAMQRGASGYMTKPFDFTRCFYTAMGLEMVDVSTVRPDPAVLARVPVEIARRHRVLPVRVAAEGLVLAMADPLDEEELVELRKRLDCSIVPLAPIGASIDEAIERCYGSIEQSVEQAANGEQLFKALVMEAASRHATHLHVGVDPTGPWVRHRIDGLLANATAPTELTARYGAVLSALRRLAQIRSGSELPQQGSLSYPVGGTTLDLHVVIFQTRYGEHAFIRMVDPAQRLPLSGLGLTPEQQRLFEPMLAKPAGLCLLAAPGRSGRRTTLYASLSHLIHASQGARRIVTLEQYIETDIPGITQIQVRPEVGLTFAQGIRLALEHDPDVLVVGELGDQETALLAVQAALSGCLVLSTVPTLDAARGIMRVSLEEGIPIAFGVLTTNNVKQSLDRAGGRHGNKGEEAALVAIEMATLMKKKR